MPHQIIPITQTEPACYGLLCQHHEQCARYHLVEGQPLTTIDTCLQGDERPLFRHIEAAKVTPGVTA